MNDLNITDWLKVTPELMTELLGKKLERKPDLYKRVMKGLKDLEKEFDYLDMASAQDTEFFMKWYKRKHNL